MGKNCCIFHGTNAHTTEECKVINRAIAKASNNVTASQSETPKQPPLSSAKIASMSHHQSQPIPPSIQSQIETVDFAAIHGEANSTNSGNYNNDNVTPYLNIYSRHITIEPNLPRVPPVDKLTFVLDSGAFPHMSNNRFLFETFFPWPAEARVQHVLIADRDSKAKIDGIGTIVISINNFTVRLQNVLYVPSLSTNLFSIKEHVQYDKCSMHIENNKFYLSFPSYTMKKRTGAELTLTAKLPSSLSDPIHFDSTQAPLSPLSSGIFKIRWRIST